MKLKVFTTVSLLSFCSYMHLNACGPYVPESPATFPMYRVYVPENTNDPAIDINCIEWQKLVGAPIPIKDIYQVVYKYSIPDMERIDSLISTSSKQKTVSGNQFAAWLIQKKDREIVRFLLLAKRCEQTRHILFSPWYYPEKEDPVIGDLADIQREALSYKGSRLRERYLLQAIRATFSLGNYEQCIELWHNQLKKLPKSYIRDKAEAYIGGAYERLGNKEEALFHYIESESIENCSYDLETVYTYAPDSKRLAYCLQQELGKVTRQSSINEERVQELLKLCKQVVREKKTQNLAMWQYTAAFLIDYVGYPEIASEYLKKAYKMPGNQIIKESIQVFQLYLDAVNNTFSADDEKRILSGLKWLDKKMEQTIRKGEPVSTYKIFWGTKEYFTDMMQRITVSILAPAYIKQGNVARAAALADIAKERYLQLHQQVYFYEPDSYKELTQDINQLRLSTTIENPIDYKSNSFILLDTVSAQDVKNYHTLLFSTSLSDFDRFLVERCYKDPDFINDLVGTKFIREGKYEEAIPYLTQVSKQYQKRLNVTKNLDLIDSIGYSQLDPFNEPWLKRVKIKSNQEYYKLEFAREMYELEQTIQQECNPEQKAMALYKYATGMYNSVSFCWNLSAYKYGSYISSCEYNWDDKTLKAKSKHLIDEALSISTNKDLQATYNIAILYLDKNLNKNSFNWLLQQYWYTATFRHYLRSCDALKDYGKNTRLSKL